MNQPLYHDTVVRINLDDISYNIRQIKQMIGSDTALAAVVKANGYGHGAVEIAPTLMQSGASLLAVATLKEAIELKQNYADYPVLIMGLTKDNCLPFVIQYSIIQTIDTLHQAEILNDLASQQKTTALIHIKYDTGFHRLGIPDTAEGLAEIIAICQLPHLKVAGIYSHLALTDDICNDVQQQKFTTLINKLEQQNIHIPLKHIADSIAGVDYPQYRLDMIRAGAIIYGLKGFHKGSLSLRQALTFHTRINHITAVQKGEGVSYDYLWKAPCDTRVGTLPFGYADGYPRSLRDKGWVSIHGKKAPIVGIICMDQCLVDLTGIPEAMIGDEVTIYGNGSDAAPDIEMVSKLAGTNKNEIVARLSARPQRVYIKTK